MGEKKRHIHTPAKKKETIQRHPNKATANGTNRRTRRSNETILFVQSPQRVAVSRRVVLGGRAGCAGPGEMSCDAAGHTPTKLPAGCCCLMLLLVLAVVALSGGRSSRRPATAAADGGPSTRRSSPFLFERRSAYPANACVRERERKRTRTGEREKRRLPSIETFEAERKPAAEVAKQGPTLRCGWWPSLCAFGCFFFVVV